MKPLTAAALVLITILTTRPAEAGEPVSIELVLGVDCSLSVDDAEFSLQMRGISAALRNPAVIGAILSHDKGVAFALFLWAGVPQQEPAVPWRVLRSEADIAALADEIDKVKNQNLGYLTAIGSAMAQAMHLLADNGYDGYASRIDISGDGKSNVGPEPAQVRIAAIAAGITINGLAVLTDDADLALYYRANVMAGPHAFVEPALDYSAFRKAMLKKLLRELEPALSEIPPPPVLRRTARLP